MEGKRCFTYCGDDRCDCGARDYEPGVIPPEGWKPSNADRAPPASPQSPVAGDLVERLRSSAQAFRDYPIFTGDGDPVFLKVQADELDEAAQALSTLASERDTMEIETATWLDLADEAYGRIAKLKKGLANLLLQVGTNGCVRMKASAGAEDAWDRAVAEARDALHSDGGWNGR